MQHNQFGDEQTAKHTTQSKTDHFQYLFTFYGSLLVFYLYKKKMPCCDAQCGRTGGDVQKSAARTFDI